MLTLENLWEFSVTVLLFLREPEALPETDVYKGTSFSFFYNNSMESDLLALAYEPSY